MLDNMRENTATLAMLPTAAAATTCIAAEPKANNIYATTIKTTNQFETKVTPSKSKSIFSWLKTTKTKSNNVDNNTSGDNISNNSSAAVTAAATTTTDQELALHVADPALLSSYREFRGVQSLRHLWNKRINAATNAKTQKLNKSSSCLLTVATNTTRDTDNATDNEELCSSLAARRCRAQSLYDCSRVTTSDTHYEEFERRHREKDNFYKYKTAAQSTQPWTRETPASTMQQMATTTNTTTTKRRLLAGIVSVDNSDNVSAHFPAFTATERGERIHWRRRDEIAAATDKRQNIGGGGANDNDKQNKAKVATTTADLRTSKKSTPPPPKRKLQRVNSSSSATSTTTARNSPQRSCRTASAASSKRSSCSNESGGGGGASNVSTLTRTRKTNGGNAATRKYSFKTHSNTYHAPRKTHASKSDANSGPGSIGGGSSMVAKLTQQFNAIIQQDRKLLQEVKRNNGVLLTRGGHVYKVIEKRASATNQTSVSSSGINRVNSKSNDLPAPKLAPSVRRAVKQFEGGSDVAKPQVPQQSAQVLRKRAELVTHKTQIANKSSGKRKSLDKAALQQKLEQLKQLQLQPLAMVQEEAKTPLEGEVLPPMPNVTNECRTQITYAEARKEDERDFRTRMAMASSEMTREKEVEEAKDTTKFKDKEIEDTEECVVEKVRKDYKNPNTKNEDENIEEQQRQQLKKQQQQQERLPPEGQATVATHLEKSANKAQENADVAAEATLTINTKITRKEAETAVVAVAYNDANDDNNDDDSNDVADAAASDNNDDEEQRKQRKHKYAKIYEKFRFRSPFRGKKSATPSTATSSTATSSASASAATSPSRSPATKSTTVAPPTEAETKEVAAIQSTVKLLDALDVIDHKLKSLADDQATQLLTATTIPIVLCNNDGDDEFEQRLLPNNSFIYQTTLRQQQHGGSVGDNQMLLTQAVNVTLVNTRGGEQLLKEQQLLQLSESGKSEKVIEIFVQGEGKNIKDVVQEEQTENQLIISPKTPNKDQPDSPKIQQRDNQTDQSTRSRNMVQAEDQQENLENNLKTSQLIHSKNYKNEKATVELSEDCIVYEKHDQKNNLKDSQQNQSLIYQCKNQANQLILLEEQVIEHQSEKEQKNEQTNLQKEYQRNNSILFQNKAKTEKQLKNENANLLKTQLEEYINEELMNGTKETDESKYPQESFIFARCKINQRAEQQVTEDNNIANAVIADTEDSIYQTLDDANAIRSQLALLAAKAKISKSKNTESSLDDYESIAGSCGQATPATATSIATKTKNTANFDGYEICEPPSDDRPSATLVRNTNDELPALPQPKRKLPKSPMPPKKTLPPVPLVTTSPPLRKAPQPPDDDDDHYYADDENIYDTIKGSHCYESLQAAAALAAAAAKTNDKSSPKSLDRVSVNSNCYESITQYRRIANASTTTMHILRNAGSTSTISSDQKTNSLYEVSLAAGLLYGGTCSSRRNSSATGGSGSGVSGFNGRIVPSSCSSNNYSHSNAASSDNSDGWIDITDNEEEGQQKLKLAAVAAAESDNVAGGATAIRQQFIVVRERNRVHRSPDWSKRVRDKRLQQKKAISCIEDDSDHYYESLSPLGNKRHSTQLVQRSNSHHKRNQDLPRYALRASQRRQQHTASAHALGQAISDDYDSFDTDTDDIYEAEDNLKNHNDSGVDIRHVKLPTPPAATNQVYAMVRKFKNFISNKKSPTSSSSQTPKYGVGGSQQKLYENSSQFYVEGNIYQNTPKSNNKTSKNNDKNGRKTTPTAAQADDYENTEFHSPPTLITPDAKQLSVSEKNLSTRGSNIELLSSANAVMATTTTPRAKSKSGKSFKSRLRKSLVGATSDSKQQLTLPPVPPMTLTPTRSTFYIEDPSHSGSGELDSGFSEKTSTGDLSTNTASNVGATSATTTITTPTAESQKFCTVARKAKKEAKLSNAQRRRTTIGIRPHEPPPPPPPADELLRNKHRSAGSTSWYAECGVFKNGTLHDEHSILNGSGGGVSVARSNQSQTGSMSMGGTSWYAEAGLYQTSGASVASSSGSSGVSTGNEAGMSDDVSHSMFQNEPLYQIYSAAKLQSISRDMEDHDGESFDGYEEIGQHGSGGGGDTNKTTERRSRPTALQLVGPKHGPSRTLWSEIPEVINSCILHTLTPRERGLQEAKFEIITSEASYLKSLNLLRSHFMNHPVFRDSTVVSARDRKALFAYIVPVHECSERLLTALESCWQDNIMLLGLSRSIYAIAEKYFHVYISFCEHQGRMDRTLRSLKETKGTTFSQNLDLLEASATCCGLNLHSFLMLPMQRITRLPLLIDAVFSKVSPNDDEYESWKMTFAIMNKIVTQCNEAANRCEQAYEIERIARQLEFPSSIRALAIAPVGVAAPGAKPRFLVKKGELTHLIWRGDDAKLTFGKKFTKTNIFAFLFSDLLVLTKRKAEQQFHVFDYCPRSMLTLMSGDLLPQLPTKDIQQTAGKNLILMTLLDNHEGKTIELVLACPSVSEQERWLQAMRPPEAEAPGEKLYEAWDCPQVKTTHVYESKEPDALSLEVGDVVNVMRKLPDGWYQGERIRDGAIGWFPGNYTKEILSVHVRARNLKQRHRLLTFSANFVKSQNGK